MQRAQKATRIQEILDELIPNTPIPLLHTDPFTLLVAVLLSAQTTDERVNEVTPALFKAGGTPVRMASLGEDQILEFIRRIGLAPTKARHVKRLAQQLLDEHEGSVPADFGDLEALPGVGHKTASVVMAQAFGVPAFPVDTHVHRLAGRWGLTSGTTVERTEVDLKRIFPTALWNKLHLQIIYFGRRYCPARGHDLRTCPICSWAATQRRIMEECGAPPSKRSS
jgi:endonuclease-3